MGFYQLENIVQEFVTPKHSTAFGPLVTGDHVKLAFSSTRPVRAPDPMLTRTSKSSWFCGAEFG